MEMEQFRVGSGDHCLHRSTAALGSTEEQVLDQGALSHKIRVKSALSVTHPVQRGVYKNGADVYRPYTSSTVFQYKDPPITPARHVHGTPTKAAILSSLCKRDTAIDICANTAWVTDNQRLCRIRHYYKDSAKPVKVIRKRPDSSKYDPLPTGRSLVSLKTADGSTTSHVGSTSRTGATDTGADEGDLKVFILNGKHVSIIRDDSHKATNTEQHYLSINNWHGADWQHKLPRMHQPRKPRYDSYASQPVGYKRLPKRYRDVGTELPSPAQGFKSLISGH